MPPPKQRMVSALPRLILCPYGPSSVIGMYLGPAVENTSSLWRELVMPLNGRTRNVMLGVDGISWEIEELTSVCTTEVEILTSFSGSLSLDAGADVGEIVKPLS